MCCWLIILVFLGPRVADILWWLVQPARWEIVFRGWPITWWLWPLLGIIFVPWMTMMFVLVGVDGLQGLDWLWVGLGLLADIAQYAGGAGRRRLPNYEGA